MRRRAVLLAVLLLSAASPAAAHGVDTRVLPTGAVTVEFRYTDGTVMAFSDAVVMPPGPAAEPAATGRTDRNGRFSFFPDQDGEWRVEVHDAGGHVARAAVTSSGQRVEVPRHAFPDWLVAVSLVLNVVGAGWIGHRRKFRPVREQETAR